MSSGGSHGGSGLPFLDKIEAWVEGTNEGAGFVVPGKVLMLVFAVVNLGFFTFAPKQTFYNFEMLTLLAPLWIPFVLVRYALARFVQFRRWNYRFKHYKNVLLEIRIPRTTDKIPLAMETVLSHLNLGPGEGTWYKKYWLGRARQWFSMELASFGGQVHFYMWTRTDMRRLLESAMYAQYPDIEIIEAEDYSRLIHPNEAPRKMFGCEYLKAKPSVYPIRTYVDFGFTKMDIKPEHQVDPLAQILELMGSIGKDEQLWIQIIFRNAKAEKFWGRKNADGSKYTWKTMAKEEVEKIRAATVMKRSQLDPVSGALVEVPGFPSPTEVQKETMAGIERNVGKAGFDVGIRSIYTAPAEKYYGTMNAYTANIFKPFASEVSNMLKPAPLFSEKFNDYPWEDPTGKRQYHELNELVEFYRRREYFHPPYRGPWMFMSSEELATLFHPPSSSVTTPGLPRIGSTTSEAPPNLPV